MNIMIGDTIVTDERQIGIVENRTKHISGSLSPPNRPSGPDRTYPTWLIT
jgi:hypothetical protein